VGLGTITMQKNHAGLDSSTGYTAEAPGNTLQPQGKMAEAPTILGWLKGHQL